jgi:Holliday junction resolvasome RuvABC endonuclease subunit
MRILAIDPGLKCGWAVYDNSTYVNGGTYKVKTPTKTQIEKKGVHPSTKWLNVRIMIDTFLDEWQPDVVVFEEVARHVGTKAAHCYGFIRYSIESECAFRNIPAYCYIPSKWRKAIGKGNDDKNKVAERVLEKYGPVEFESDDHSDAMGIGWAATILLEEESLQSG